MVEITIKMKTIVQKTFKKNFNHYFLNWNLHLKTSSIHLPNVFFEYFLPQPFKANFSANVTVQFKRRVGGEMTLTL